MNNTASKSLTLGISFALLNAFMLAGMSLFAKQLAAYLGPVEVTFFRSLFGASVLLAWFLLSGNLSLLKTASPLKHMFRGLIGTMGVILGIWALALMPLAETTVLLFTSPLFTVLLSYPMLKEKVGIYRLGAVFMGFLGVLLVVGPFTTHEKLPLLGIAVGLGWGFFSGLVDVWLRLMGKTENANTTTFYFLLFGLFSTSLHWPFATLQSDSFSIPALWLILGLGTTGVICQLAKTHSYRLGEVAIIAPMMYTMIIWSMIFDYLFWNNAPSWNVIAGALVIVASNIFIVVRESYLRKKKILHTEPVENIPGA